MYDFRNDYFKMIIVKLTNADTVESNARSFSVNHSVFWHVLQKMIICVIVNVWNKSNNASNLYSWIKTILH